MGSMPDAIFESICVRLFYLTYMVLNMYIITLDFLSNEPDSRFIPVRGTHFRESKWSLILSVGKCKHTICRYRVVVIFLLFLKGAQLSFQHYLIFDRRAEWKPLSSSKGATSTTATISMTNAPRRPTGGRYRQDWAS